MYFGDNRIHSNKTCKMNENFEKYIEYIQTNHWCNLASLNVKKYKKLKTRHKIIKKNLRQPYGKSSNILRELNEIEKNQQKIMNN